MKTKFTILFLINLLAVIALTWYLLFEIEHHVWKIRMLLTAIMLAASVAALFFVYIRYLSLPSQNTNR